MKALKREVGVIGRWEIDKQNLKDYLWMIIFYMEKMIGI